MVCYEIPNRPKECAECGFEAFLSVNGGTGEVVCMRSGCGCEHGFSKKEVTIPLKDLVNISHRKKIQKREKWLKEVDRFFESAQKDEIISSELKDECIANITKILSST